MLPPFGFSASVARFFLSRFTAPPAPILLYSTPAHQQPVPPPRCCFAQFTTHSPPHPPEQVCGTPSYAAPTHTSPTRSAPLTPAPSTPPSPLHSHLPSPPLVGLQLPLFTPGPPSPQVCGTPSYAAPEVFRASRLHPYDPFIADVWCAHVLTRAYREQN
jgi:serine/threonine protein kinase